MIAGDGRIVTFYSFKGGVGRTMALTNTAFLAAANGLRVLVMDWDLEAPGIPYYFRGQLEPLDEADLATRPGIVDMVAEWTQQVESATSTQDADKITASYERAEAFEKFVSILVPPERLAPEGCLHAITAGASRGGDAKRTAYEQTLADFSWPDFFGRDAGGLLIAALRSWARSAYDLILVDSRTGFADVAGICTVQLPDLVALCFILNRQNLEGTAKVAAAIRRQRKGDVDIRLVPMRLSREGTSEEADAQAFARDVLRRTGLVQRDRVEADLQKLRIRSADGVPFYETLAPFVPTDPRKDLLTLDYATLAEELLNRPIQIMPIDPTWRDAVRRRLEPRQATLAYLAELELAEPARAREEIDALIGSANHFLETGRNLDEDYIDALIKVTLGISEGVDADLDDQTSPIDGLVILLRRLFEKQPELWRLRLANILERILLEESGLATLGDEVATIEDIDAILVGAPLTTSLVLRRARLRQRLARTQLYSSSLDDALSSIDLADSLIVMAKSLESNLEERAEIADVRLQGVVMRGDAKLQAGDGGAAAMHFSEALELSKRDTISLKTRSDILLRLVRAYLEFEPRSATTPALEWAELNGGSQQALGRLPQLVDAISASDDPSSTSRKLIKLLFPRDGQNSLSKTSGYLGRYLGASSAVRFVVAAAKLIDLVPDDHIREVEDLVNAASLIFLRGGMRGSVSMSGPNAEFRGSVDVLISIANTLNLGDASDRLTIIAEQLARSNLRSSVDLSEQND